MIVYLNAECVIDRLIAIGFIESEKSWKRQNPIAKKYYAIFNHVPTKGKLCFEVHVENGIHKLSAFYINNLERIHARDLSAIVNACVIN